MVENKLDFLMNLTGTKNSILSKAVSFDPSYISRIRTGRRELPDSPQFIEPVASYFSRNIRSEYQRNILCTELCPGELLPEDREELQAMLTSWLYQEQSMSHDAVGSFLHGFASATSATAGMSGRNMPDIAPEELVESIRLRTESLEQGSSESWFFYGNEGKRRAVEIFLGRLCISGKAYRLLLFSDEEMSWLYEDPAFAKRWAGLLFRLLSTGSRITIPHNITRDSNEMFEAVQKWIPLYMTGAIEPYYYPRLRDGVFRRSLFIAEGDSALVSSSVGTGTDGMLNLLVSDRAAVQAFQLEFETYLGLCRPLMHIAGPSLSRSFLHASLRYEKEKGDLLAAQPLPSFFTMPQPAVQALLTRSGDPAFGEYHAKSYAAFREHMRSGDQVTEILHLPSPAEVRSGGFLLPLCDFFDSPKLYITASELAQHLKNVIRLLRRENAYRIVISSGIPTNIILTAKESAGSQLICAAPPTTAFTITEPNMTMALREYLVRLAGTPRPGEKETVIRHLESYIRELEK